jgi:tetratricopeptide (TPR) repeat protein
MDLRRVVQIWAREHDGRDRPGSGYLLTDSLVLTASHVLGLPTTRRSEGVLAADDVLVQSHWVDRTIKASKMLGLGGDIALLLMDRPFKHPLGPAPVRGAVGSAAVVLPAVVVGYPALALQDRPNSPGGSGQEGAPEDAEQYRRDTQLDGEISIATGFGDGTLTVHLDQHHFPQRGVGQAGGSVFGGLSGAAIFIGGYLVGVVTQDPRPEHPTVLVGQRLDPVVRNLREPTTAPEGVPLMACSALDQEAEVDVSVTAGARAVREAHLWQARTILENIPGGRLRDRGPELSRMAQFCADPADRYLVWHANEWSGKSALLATFVAEPPARVDIVAFFVNSNDTEARTSDRYLASLINQLEAYLDGPPGAVNVAVPGAALGRYRDLLARAAAAAQDGGRQLVLVVDALDEDEAFTPQPVSSTPIAALLPADVPHLQVIVATRPYRQVLTATPAHHPFRATIPVQLSSSPHAADIRDEAAREVRKAATGTDAISSSILAFLQVAGGGLTPAELAELSSRLPGRDLITPAATRARLQAVLHRAVRQRVRRGGATRRSSAAGGEERYEWAHATLPGIALDELGPTLIDTHAQALHQWAEEHRERGWGDASPGYLEAGYPRLLASAGRTAQLTAYALDQARHRWLHTRRGGNDQALTEIQRASELHAQSVPRDIGSLVLLAFERDRLQERYGKLPTVIPAVWAMIGNIDRAEALAQSMPSQTKPWALGGVARALAAAGNAAEAERIAGTINDADLRARTLPGVARALAAAGRTAEAERIAGAINQEYLRAWALAGVAGARAAAGNIGEAERIAAEAEQVASAITEGGLRARALAEVARTLAGAGNIGETERIAAEAERIASAISDQDLQTQALARVARALAAAGNIGEAERIADTIIEEDGRVDALVKVAQALATAGNIGEAERITAVAEGIASAITEEDRRAGALVKVIRALADTGRAAEAERLAGTITDDDRRAQALTEVARVLAAAGNAAEAQRIAGTITGHDRRTQALARVARALAAAGNNTEADRVAAEAERIAGAITEGGRALGLAGIAQALAAAGNISGAERVAGEAELAAGEAERVAGQAELIAGAVTGEDRRAQALADIARALAAAGNIGEAERLAGTIAQEYSRAQALADIARALAAAGNIGEAERLAGTITEEYSRAQALADIARALAAAGNIGEAERLAGTITDVYTRVQALADIARALAAAGNTGEAERIVGEAERLAGTITEEYRRAQALADIARALAAAGNTGEAERLAGTITDVYTRVQALADIARTLAAAGNTGEAERIVGEAERLAGTITEEYRRAQALADIAHTLADLARALAVVGHAFEAERVAAAITGRDWRVWLVESTQTMSDPGGSHEVEQVAAAIIEEYRRAEALADIAQALTTAGKIAEAERIACQVLMTDRWPLVIKPLLESGSVEAAGSWLTTEVVTELITRERTLPGLGVRGPEK